MPLMECIRTALHNYAGTFMAGPANRQRVMILGVLRPIAMPNVATADRYPLQLDEALAILDRRHLCIDELEELGTHQLCCFHTLSISRKHAELAQRIGLCTRTGYTICSR